MPNITTSFIFRLGRKDSLSWYFHLFEWLPAEKQVVKLWLRHCRSYWQVFNDLTMTQRTNVQLWRKPERRADDSSIIPVSGLHDELDLVSSTLYMYWQIWHMINSAPKSTNFGLFRLLAMFELPKKLKVICKTPVMLSNATRSHQYVYFKRKPQGCFDKAGVYVSALSKHRLGFPNKT